MLFNFYQHQFKRNNQNMFNLSTTQAAEVVDIYFLIGCEVLEKYMACVNKIGLPVTFSTSTGKMKPTMAFMSGKLKIKGDMTLALKMEKMMGLMKPRL